MEAISKQIAKDLLKIKAVFFRPEEPFTWASGIKSPVYCDNRLTLTSPEVRTDVENALAETIRREYPGAEVLMGTSTAGIAHAAITGHIMNLPMGYVRSGSKDHGRQNQIEGRLDRPLGVGVGGGCFYSLPRDLRGPGLRAYFSPPRKVGKSGLKERSSLRILLKLRGLFVFALFLWSVRPKPGFRSVYRAKRLFQDGFGSPYRIASGTPGNQWFTSGLSVRPTR